MYNIFDPIGLKLLTRLRLGFSHLNEHKFRHNFQDCLNPLCLCSLEIEDTIHYLLQCQYFSEHRIPFLIILNLFLTMTKEIYCYMATHGLTQIKINLF